MEQAQLTLHNKKHALKQSWFIYDYDMINLIKKMSGIDIISIPQMVFTAKHTLL